MATHKFTHLHLHSHYSLLDGLTKIDELIARIKELGMDSVALTDHGAMYGAVEFYQKAKKGGIKPIIGCEVYVCEGNMRDKTNAGNQRYHLVLLAKDEIGYKNLVQLVSKAHLEGFYYKPRIDKELLEKHSEGLICLSACLAGELCRTLRANQYERAKDVALWHQKVFGKDNYFIELQHHSNIPEQVEVNPLLIKLARELGIPVVATCDSHYLKKEDANAHDVLLAVQTGNSLDDKDRLTMKHDDFSVKNPEEMWEHFKDIPEALENTNKIADMCRLELKLGEPQLPHYDIPEGYDTMGYIRELCLKGLPYRYPNGADKEVMDRLEYELDIIGKTGFASYFLIVQDFVNWAKKQGIVVGPGRGSAAGSLASYLLNITNIDPLAYGLYFERFLNPERIAPPDIDLDFDDARRHEVIEYVSKKYGADHVAQIITFGTMASRGSIRDAGRALGYSYDFCDKIAKMIPFGHNLDQTVKEVSDLKHIYQTDPQTKILIDSARRLEGVVRHASTHACGVVITKEPITSYLPIQKSTGNDDSVITQYDMNAVEALGLLKMDFLGLSNLTIIEHTLKLIDKIHGKKIDIDKIPLDDPETFKLFQEARTTSIFQLESSGMKRYIKELKPTNLDDIAVMISLYRPGPMELIPDYIARKHGQRPVTYLHPKLEPILKDTHGIMIYQEQLLAAVRELTGFSLAQADVLRKAVGKKIKKLLDEQEAGFKEAARRYGTPDDIADKFWALVEPFNRYGFNKSHAVCYAMIAYQTAYLKAHYPVEFMAAVMNSEAGDVERVAFLIDEAREMAIEVLPPNINESFEMFSVVGKNKIRFGLKAIKNVGENVVSEIIKTRNNHGYFKNLEDVISNVKTKDLNKKSLESLIKCGALDDFGERSTLLANVDQLLSFSKETQRNLSTGQDSLFGLFNEGSALPSIRLKEAMPASNSEKLMWEKELLGLFVSAHPLKEYQEQLYLERVVPIKDVSIGDGRVSVGGVITKVQRVVTKTGKPMLFAWVEDTSSKIETLVFPGVLEKYPEIFKENAIVVVKGRLNDKDGVPKLLCEDVKSVASLA